MLLTLLATFGVWHEGLLVITDVVWQERLWQVQFDSKDFVISVMCDVTGELYGWCDVWIGMTDCVTRMVGRWDWVNNAKWQERVFNFTGVYFERMS